MENVQLLLEAKKINFISDQDRKKFIRKLKILALPVGTTEYVDPLEFERSFSLYSKNTILEGTF
jgi:Zn finger protein HypA/HybF involved in hydrogenase expression